MEELRFFKRKHGVEHVSEVSLIGDTASNLIDLMCQKEDIPLFDYITLIYAEDGNLHFSTKVGGSLEKVIERIRWLADALETTSAGS